MSRFLQVLVAVTLVAGVLGQDTSNDASTVSPQDIYDLSEDDFKLWLSGRQPKAWEGGSSSSSSSTATSAPQTTTLPSVFRTTTNNTPTTPTTTPTTPNFLTTSTTIRPIEPSSDGKSWFEEEDTATPRPDLLGDQFKPAGEDFAQWLERQMNRVQEVTFVPQTTLTGDQLAGAGLVTRLTTIRNRIPATTFPPLPVTDFAPVTTSAPPPPPAPAPSSAPAYLPAEQDTIAPAAAAPGPLDLQQWLRDQLQTSQRLTDNLLAQWTPSGSIVRSDGQHYTPNAVSYQTSALVHGLHGVSHSGHVRHQPIPVAVHHNAPTIRRVFYPAGSFIYSHPPVPQYSSYVGNYKAPLVIKYH
ncbi:mucin-5AC-like isoform X1 [Anopheles stephensi]|uniref:mucin-5AC-like isoform X1 n=1 Tax=Anopheles stephensi TaxID=30069 RepID=UPI00165897BA|nr:mucin-5AC-like isoform X1 [Anopheles stephensi]XP_035907809.1 mucin-5AC-like isoform X1 [Anopheles stephensi]